eukprot:COSAG05_NODE_11136_length_529_cov_0.655814_1_plen_23_part_10
MSLRPQYCTVLHNECAREREADA